MISQWIDTGLRENAGSSVAAMRTLGFKAAPLVDGALGAVPTNLPAINPIETRRPYPLLALATSPRAPVVAASRYTAIELLTPSSRSPLGTIPFPEGEPLAITFSRSGRLLLVAGGKPVRSGAVDSPASGKQLPGCSAGQSRGRHHRVHLAEQHRILDSTALPAGLPQAANRASR